MEIEADYYDDLKIENVPMCIGYISDVEEYVFKIPKSGLPPLFHVKGIPIKVFVSHKARVALKKAKITGIKYYSLKGIRWGKGMFVDVPTPIQIET